MPRGGERTGSGRKATGRLRTQIPVRVPPRLRRQLELLANRNGISLTKQTEQLLEKVLSWPAEWMSVDAGDGDDMRGWRGKHQHALGRVVAHAAGRVEGAMGIYPGPRRWSDDPAATLTVRTVLDQILEEHGNRRDQLSPGEIALAKSWGSGIAQLVIDGLDRDVPAPLYDPEQAIRDGDTSRILVLAGDEMGWRKKQGE